MAQPFLLSIDVAGDKQLQRGLSRFGKDVKDLKEPFREIVKDFHQIMEEQFDTEGGYGSGGWKPLTPATTDQKARYGFPSSILVRTGLLKESLLGGNPWSIESVKPLELKLGTKVPYSIYHQKGGGRLPERPIIQLTDGDKTRWMKIIHKYLVTQIKKEFAGLMPTIGAGKSHVGSI